MLVFEYKQHCKQRNSVHIWVIIIGGENSALKKSRDKCTESRCSIKKVSINRLTYRYSTSYSSSFKYIIGYGEKVMDLHLIRKSNKVGVKIGLHEVTQTGFFYCARK